MAGPLITGYLIDSETHAIEFRHHWAFLTKPLLTTGAFWSGGLIALGLTVHVPILRATWVFFLLFSLGWLGWYVVEWWFERFVITNRRVLLLSGVFTKKLAIMPLAKVTDLTYERTFPGRLLGYGTFIMESAGLHEALNKIEYLPAPAAIYHEVSRLLFGAAPAGQTDDGTGADLSLGRMSDDQSDQPPPSDPGDPFRGYPDQPTGALPGRRGARRSDRPPHGYPDWPPDGYLDDPFRSYPDEPHGYPDEPHGYPDQPHGYPNPPFRDYPDEPR
ncbi:MAG: PH domain-containing protein, partial [Frankiaceae bacterium]|nr:PH domain-containing protein [Frankiaceae bacterium]